jgi:hypothetical protein
MLKYAPRLMKTREPQYERCFEVPPVVLGPMCSQRWEDDPRMLGIVLARYKFVAKMLSGRQHVAEVGAGDRWASRVVRQEVAHLTCYDIEEAFVDVGSNISARWKIASKHRDILEAPLTQRTHSTGQGFDGAALPEPFDAIYSLDCIEHIRPGLEGVFAVNMVASLADHGVVIIGTPSLESQGYASPQSKAGHVNCFTGDRLRELMERVFHVVLMFGMNDEVLHTGFLPMSHYLIAVCTGKKDDHESNVVSSGVRYDLREKARGKKK